MLMEFPLLEGLYYLLGFVYSVLIGAFITSRTIFLYYTDYQEAITKHRWRVNMLGMVERVLYTSSWLVGFPEFLAIWLALKVAGQWDRWKQDFSRLKKDDASNSEATDVARVIYTGYLLGNALSISFALVGGITIQNLICNKWGSAIVFPIVHLFSCMILYLYIRNNVKVHSRVDNGTDDVSA